jgi:hypothetical protein
VWGARLIHRHVLMNILKPQSHMTPLNNYGTADLSQLSLQSPQNSNGS